MGHSKVKNRRVQASLTFDELRDLVRQKPEVPPKGWHTITEISRMWGKSLVHVGRLLRATPEKVVPRRKFRVMARDRIVHVTHYKIGRAK
jgi:hypothetical protein